MWKPSQTGPVTPAPHRNPPAPRRPLRRLNPPTAPRSRPATRPPSARALSRARSPAPSRCLSTARSKAASTFPATASPWAATARWRPASPPAKSSILGKVRGNVSATDRVDIRAEGALTGDVAAARISIEDGAFFKGGIDIRKSEAKPVVCPGRARSAQADSAVARFRFRCCARAPAAAGFFVFSGWCIAVLPERQTARIRQRKYREYRANELEMNGIDNLVNERY